MGCAIRLGAPASGRLDGPPMTPDSSTNLTTSALKQHSQKKKALAARLRAGAGPVALAKETSNLFRDREAAPRQRLDAREFNEVLSVTADAVDAEGMITYEDLTRECL